MVTIPPRRDPILDAIDRILEAETNGEPKRDYIGASSIGESCSRKLWYRYHTDIKETFDADTIRKFNDGHRCEEIMAALLRKVEGIELHTHKPDGTQYGFADGPFRGNYDGVIRGIRQSDKWHIWEHKSVAEKSFEELRKLKASDEKSALKRWKPIYYAQAVVYMHYEGLGRHYMTVSTPGLRDYMSVRTEDDPAYAEALKMKAHRLLRRNRLSALVGGIIGSAVGAFFMGCVMPDCAAKQYSDQMVCKKCGLTWDMNDYDPPKCKPDKKMGWWKRIFNAT